MVIGRLQYKSAPIRKGVAKFTTRGVPALGASHLFFRVASKVHNPVDTFVLFFGPDDDINNAVKVTAITPATGIDDTPNTKITDRAPVRTWTFPSPCPYEFVFVRFNLGAPQNPVTEADLDYVPDPHPYWQPPPIPQPDIIPPVDPVTGEQPPPIKQPDIIPPAEPDPKWVREPNRPLANDCKSPGLSITLTAWAA